MTFDRLGKVFVFLICVVFALVIVVPFLIIVVNSFKGAREAALFTLTLPETFMLDNYRTVLGTARLARGFTNSIVISVSTVVITNLIACMAAFVIQRRGGTLHRIIYLMFIMGLIVPISIIPTIRLLMQLRLHNTYPGIILYYVAINLPFTVFLFTGFMKAIPRELDESVLIDGGSYFRLFAQIIMPLLSTTLVTATIVVMINVWNDFMGPFYLISDSRKWTVMLNIFSFISMYQTHWGAVFAFMVLVVSPLIIIYFIMQKRIINGLTAGSLKG